MSKGMENRTNSKGHKMICFYFAILLMLCVLCYPLFPNSFLQQSYPSSEPVSQDVTNNIAKATSKIKLSFGYDNNVLENIKDKIESRFFQLYIDSSLYVFPTEKTLISLRLQDGLEHLDAVSLSGESILINNLNLHIYQKISNWLIPEIQGDIIGRTSIHNDSYILPSEEAYMVGSIGPGIKSIILDDISLRMFYKYKFTNFDDFDPFDRISHIIGLRTDIKLLPGASAGIQYYHENGNYNKWDIINPDTGSKRSDILNDISIFTQFYKYYLFDITYSYQNNSSSINGYSYRSNRIAILIARELKWDIMLQLHGHIRFKTYLSQPGGFSPDQIDIENDEREMLTAKISREIGRFCDLEAKYEFRRGKSSQGNDFYTKRLFSLSLSSLF